MSSKESILLRNTNSILDHEIRLLKSKVDPYNCRLSILEAAASIIGAWDLEEFNMLFNQSNILLEPSESLRIGLLVIAELKKTEIPIPLGLAALAREPIDKSSQKSSGAYYTDWRLAQLLAEKSVSKVEVQGKWVDPACGSGTLLVAALLEAKRLNLDIENLISNSITGADLSERALRGARLSISSLTKNLSTVAKMNLRLLHQDSLQSSHIWEAIASNGFALVIGNPPWEKLKVTRHDVAFKRGEATSYGEKIQYSESLMTETSNSRLQMLEYVEKVASGKHLQGSGESDLYKLFMELGMAICTDNGVLALLVPAGLIRSQGTYELRRVLIQRSSSLGITVLENRQKHFDIDIRFKFLVLAAKFSTLTKSKIDLEVADRSGNLGGKPVSISQRELMEFRPDLSLPEVRSIADWKLFKKLSISGSTLNTSGGPWEASFTREVDMTNDSIFFQKSSGKNRIPIIEGRHVSQFRYRSKSYVSGGGRSAIWHTVDRRKATFLKPQWWIEQTDLRENTKLGVQLSRIGFCDISGQTNERTLLASRIPENNVCGNKVPTIQFLDNCRDREDLFLALANSFVVDWMLRRQVTTTINFFILESLVFPNLDLRHDLAQKIIRLARKASCAEGNEKVGHWSLGVIRAQIDSLVATAYGLDLDDLNRIFLDFPLLDRGQPALDAEQSSITSDLVKLEFSKLQKIDTSNYGARVARARRIGAIPYLPADYAQGDE